MSRARLDNEIASSISCDEENSSSCRERMRGLGFGLNDTVCGGSTCPFHMDGSCPEFGRTEILGHGLLSHGGLTGIGFSPSMFMSGALKSGCRDIACTRIGLSCWP